MTGRRGPVVDQMIRSRLLASAGPRTFGRVRSLVGTSIEVEGLVAAVGDHLILHAPNGPVDAEVVAVRANGLVCMPFAEPRGIPAGIPVEAHARPLLVPGGAGALGRVLDGLGRPIDGGAPLAGVHPVHNVPPHPLTRPRIADPMWVGVRAIDTMATLGRGQRLGIFAGSGVGKSTLLSMIARNTEADVTVLALIGERGREVREFIEADLGPEGLARSVVVVATSDQPALVRRQAAFTATRIAESLRDEGRHVVLMCDSLTRFCMAQREIGLAAGEPPTTRGYPPSTFALLPQLLERAGADAVGSITGLYTVLVEGDDMNEPVADAARSILDGHIVLSRALAHENHYPSIDILESISRCAGQVISVDERQVAGEFRKLLAAYRDARDLIEIGAYRPGTNPDVDRAMATRANQLAFLQQGTHELTAPIATWDACAESIGLRFERDTGPQREPSADAALLETTPLDEWPDLTFGLAGSSDGS